jgi:GT2 family glycosyltransferase
MSVAKIIKKAAMLTVKFFVGLLPKSFRNWLKRSPYLTSIYSRNLQKSGLFYGFPSRKKLDALYTKNRQYQALLIQQKTLTFDGAFNVVVIVTAQRVKLLQETMTSITNLNSAKVTVSLVCMPQINGACEDVLALFFGKVEQVGIVNNFAELTSSSGFFIYAGDLIHPDCPKVLKNHQGWDSSAIYCDTDLLEKGMHTAPRFLPDWDPILQLSTAYVRTGCWLPNCNVFTQVILPISEQSLSLLFAHMALLNLESVGHVSLVLINQLKSMDGYLKSYGENLSTILAFPGTVTFDKSYNTLAVSWPIDDEPMISIIIPTRNSLSLVKTSIESILQLTTYQNYEIILVDNNSDDPECLRYFDELCCHPKLRLLRYPFPFNYSAINNFAVSHALGKVVCLLNNDVEVISPCWLSVMLSWVQQQNVGCVGAKLLYPDGRIQHAGVVMGYGGGAGHAHKYFPRYHAGYLGRLAASGCFSAVTAACLLVKKEDYVAVGGLNEKELTVAFNDVDFCLKIKSLGRRNIYCAEAVLFHHESVSRGLDDNREKRERFESELTYLQEKWSHVITNDPAYNPNLTLRRENFSIKTDSEIFRH